MNSESVFCCILITFFTCGCIASKEKTENRSVEVESIAEKSARKVAEREVSKREPSWNHISSRVIQTTERSSGTELVVLVERIPKVPGSERYVTVVGNKVVNYGLGK